MKYKEPCSIAKYTETTTKFHYELTNSFVSGEFDARYAKRFPIIEGINGYLKRKKWHFIFIWTYFTIRYKPFTSQKHII